MRVLALLIAFVALAGCGSSTYIVCKGRGMVTAQGFIYDANVSADCGEGFQYYRDKKPPTATGG